MRVTLPWPPLASSPNGSQGNFRAKASAGRGYKWDAHICCKRDKLRKITAVECVTITFHKTDLGTYDLDNMLARIKRGLDAIASAIGVDDGKWQEVRLRRGHVINGGAVVVDITDRPAGVVMVPVVGIISEQGYARKERMMPMIEVKLKPWIAPNFVAIDSDGKGSAEGSIPIGSVAQHDLDEMVSEWLTSVYDKAGKKQPWKNVRARI